MEDCGGECWWWWSLSSKESGREIGSEREAKDVMDGVADIPNGYQYSMQEGNMSMQVGAVFGVVEAEYGEYRGRVPNEVFGCLWVGAYQEGKDEKDEETEKTGECGPGDVSYIWGEYR